VKTTISTEWLSGCSGCHVAIVDMHEKLLTMMDFFEFVRIPVLMDQKFYPPADIGLVEGAVRNKHDRESLIKMRESVKTLVAFGTCAVYGGPSGIGWLSSPEAVLQCVYGQEPTNVPHQLPDTDTTLLEQSVIPIDEVVKVDAYMPGCPPHPFWIVSALGFIVESGNAPKSYPAKTVCSKCKRTMKKMSDVSLKKGIVSVSDPNICLLSQGVICLGSVTLERCLAQCPNCGIACSGCAGPSTDIITEPHLDIRTLLSKRMHLLTGIKKEEIQAYIEQEAKTFYAYSLASPVIYKKPTVKIREWTAESIEE
jgi:F420-non-reducing hydrogenase small subunit